MTDEIDTNEIRAVIERAGGAWKWPFVSRLCDALDEARENARTDGKVISVLLGRAEKAEAELALWDLAWTRECRAEAAIARVRALCEASLLNPGSIRAFMAADILAAFDGDVS